MIGSAIVWANRTLGWGAIPALFLAGTLAFALALLPLAWVTALILAALVLVGTLIRPQFGVLLVVVAVPFGSVLRVNLGFMNVGLTELIVGLALASWLVRQAVFRTPVPTRAPLTVPMLVFLAVVSFSLLVSGSLEHGLKEVVKWAEVVAIYVLVASEMDDRWCRALVALVLVTGALAALHGIYQFLFQVGPEGFVLFDRFMRAYGTFEQPNPYAGYLGLSLPLAVGLLAASLLPRGEKLHWSWTALAACSGAVTLMALGMSWSRGAWLGFAVALGAMLLVTALHSGRAAVFGTVCIVLLISSLSAVGLARLPPSIVQRINDFVPFLGVTDVVGAEVTDANFALVERMAHWQAAVAMWTDHPWLGVGIGNYEPAYAQYALPQWPLALGHAHNYYLNIGAEAGLLGLLAYLLLWGAAFVVVWRVVRWSVGWWWGVALGVLGILVHLSVHNLFDNLFVHAMYLQVAILLGVVTTHEQAQQPN